MGIKNNESVPVGLQDSMKRNIFQLLVLIIAASLMPTFLTGRNLPKDETEDLQRPDTGAFALFNSREKCAPHCLKIGCDANTER